MNILVIGMGIVGKATARVFNELGYNVLCRDINGNRPTSDICFVCVPEDSITEAIRGVETGCLVVRSTTIPGTIASLGDHICHNPCFIREETAQEDSMYPRMIVIGECCKNHGDILERLYSNFSAPIFRIDITTSEMIKLALNCYLATQISFWNELKRICDRLGISSDRVAEVCKRDDRVSKYGTLWHGHPFKGRCLPKDLGHMVGLFITYGEDAKLLEAVGLVNRSCESELYIASRTK